MPFASLDDWITAAPLAFTVGFFVGLGLASKYRITRANPPNTQGTNEHEEGKQ